MCGVNIWWAPALGKIAGIGQASKYHSVDYVKNNRRASLESPQQKVNGKIGLLSFLIAKNIAFTFIQGHTTESKSKVKALHRFLDCVICCTCKVIIVS